LYGASISGWSAGFTAWFGCLLMVAAAGFVLAQRMGREVPQLPVGPAVAAAGGAVVGLAFVVIRWLTLPRVKAGLAGSVGPRFGIWLAIIAGIVEVAGAVMEFRGSGETLPWATGEAGAAPPG
jgi:hypothetical protein